MQVSLGGVAGRDHEEVVCQAEEEGDKVAKGADHVPLVSLPRNRVRNRIRVFRATRS